MVKTFKNLLQNQKSYDYETWHGLLYKVYIIINDPKFSETCFCTYSRPRYQVSVYRTNDPLVR